MRKILLPAIILCSFPGPALAGWQDVINWCETETSTPKQAQCIARVMPDGNVRGMRSAANLTGEARKAARNGNADSTLAWMLECVCHDPNAQNELRAAGNELMQRLK